MVGGTAVKGPLSGLQASLRKAGSTGEVRGSARENGLSAQKQIPGARRTDERDEQRGVVVGDLAPPVLPHRLRLRRHLLLVHQLLQGLLRLLLCLRLLLLLLLHGHRPLLLLRRLLLLLLLLGSGLLLRLRVAHHCCLLLLLRRRLARRRVRLRLLAWLLRRAICSAHRPQHCTTMHMDFLETMGFHARCSLIQVPHCTTHMQCQERPM